jgi:hypothetical protein
MQSAAEKEWTTIVIPADDFDFVGDKNELCGPLQTEGGHFFEWEEGCLRLHTRVLDHKALQDQIISPDLRPLITWMHDEVIVRLKAPPPPNFLFYVPPGAPLNFFLPPPPSLSLSLSPSPSHSRHRPVRVYGTAHCEPKI